jgi:hypothetical protein
MDITLLQNSFSFAGKLFQGGKNKYFYFFRQKNCFEHPPLSTPYSFLKGFGCKDDKVVCSAITLSPLYDFGFSLSSVPRVGSVWPQ